MKEQAVPRCRSRDLVSSVSRTATRAAQVITWAGQVWAAAMYLAALNRPALRGELFAEDPVFAVCLWASVACLALLWVLSLWAEQRAAHGPASRRSYRRAALAAQSVLLLVALAATYGRSGWAAWWFDLMLLFLGSAATWAGWMRCITSLPVNAAPEPAAVNWQIPSGKHTPIVYFIRNGNRMKIGTTTDLKRRIRTLALRAENVALLLAGDRRLEHRLHGRFTDFRIGDTEWFAYEGALADYVNDQIESIARKDQGK